ncbi:nucleotide exchange factor GrpE [Glycocaulis profundi]|nr:nucleotide exchange factor GrpE [Glycocaulis profundi]
MSAEHPEPEDEIEMAADLPEDAQDEAPEEIAPDLQAQVDDLRDRLLRAVADAENTRKRAAREVKETREYAVTGFARDMLDVADSLNRALASLDEAARAELPASVANFLEGVQMTERKLHSTLERHGVKKLEPAEGDPLDPNRHQAAAQIPAPQPKGRIAHVMQPGYVIGERTLRAAMVVVSAGPPEGEAKPDDGAAPGDGLDMKA